ncbi:hypothetical protein FQR65_LT04802 [Abscondita terminalis]|nr:hypothetical protein FQR65_LT04802 [Abscondita terminalis]
MSPIQNIKNQIETIISWIQPFLPIANSHMVEFFSESIFKKSLPDNLYNEILSIGFDNSLDLILNDTQVLNAPELYSYINESKQFHLCNLTQVCLSRNDLNAKLIEWGSKNISSLKLEVFVTPKKAHEIEVLGGGKGYLGSLLALHHNIRVLSVDASLINTHGALKRLKLLERAWKNLKHNPRQSVPLNKEDVAKNTNLYKQITEFVNEDTNFGELIKNEFLDESSNFGLVGLHTCGDLGSTCVKIFNKNDQIKTLCNVACCYHLLSEEFDGSNSETKNFGFPLSTLLRNKEFKLGRISRMLSAQSMERILYKKEVPSRTLFYRAILEVLLDKYNVDTDKRKVGKLKKECKSFVNYVHSSISNIDPTFKICNDEIDDLFNEYKCYEKQLYVFHMLRCMLAPVIESLILLDRLLFLYENGHESALLVHLFDAVVSPRCYGLIAFKNM